MGKKTTLYDYHSSHAYMGKYAGFEMPLWFEGIAPEVKAVRNGAGVFDISHMGRVLFKGRDSGEYLDILTTNEISSLEPFQARYGLMCDERGGILDDLIVTRLSEE